MLTAIISMAQQANPKVTGHSDMARLKSKNQFTGLMFIKGGRTFDFAGVG
jgi:hypothetical protein